MSEPRGRSQRTAWKHIKRNAAAYLALTVALSTSAYAGVTLEKDSVRGYHVDESTLQRVPRARYANKTKSQVIEVVKLDESIGEPAAPPTLLDIGSFTFMTTCRRDGVDKILEVKMTAPDRFGWSGTPLPWWETGGVVTVLKQTFLANSDVPTGRGTTIAASTEAGAKTQFLTGHISSRMNHLGSECVAIFSLLVK